MSEAIPVHPESRAAYDARYAEHVRLQKLSHRVLYTMMLEIEDNRVDARRALVHLPANPLIFEDNTAVHTAVTFLDDDAQPVRTLFGAIQYDLFTLDASQAPISNQHEIRRGYFVAEDALESVRQQSGQDDDTAEDTSL